MIHPSVTPSYQTNLLFFEFLLSVALSLVFPTCQVPIEEQPANSFEGLWAIAH